MNKHFFKEIKIKNVRGIDEATLKDLSGVNLLLGGNNGGKTSVLEAISLLNCSDIYDFISASLMRNGSNLFNGIANVRYLFKTHSDTLSVVGTRYEGEAIALEAKYNVFKTIPNSVFAQAVGEKGYALTKNRLKKETDAISLELTIDGKKKEACYSEPDFFAGAIKQDSKMGKKGGQYNILYVSPCEHFFSFELLVSDILRSSDYKTLTIELMKLIDPSVEDILINVDPSFGTPDVYIKTKGEDPVPISLFGDGAKKALILACYIAKAKGGLLLIDEIETSLHHSLYDDLFRFLVKASKHFGVQLFITTHSQEVIDCFLKATEEEPKALKCYTIRKDEKGVSVRDLDHSEVQKYSELGIEVRD